jgi:serine/threonine protein phosphatase 1
LPPATGLRRAAVPAGTVVYALGDIHGCADLLAELHRSIFADAAGRAAQRRVIVYLGDYASRRPHGRKVIEMLLHPAPRGFERVTLKGNHEDVLLRFLDGEIGAGETWMQCGGIAALREYGIDGFQVGTVPDLASIQRRFRAAFPDDYERFYRSLALRHREGGYGFVHGGVRPGVLFEEQSEHDLIWIREPFLQSNADFGLTIVHGHSIVKTPEVRDNRIGIDTGAFKSGVLTCLVLEGETREFLQTFP